MIIYKIKNKINGKIYIGQTSYSLHERWLQHCGNSASRSAIAAAIQKYGAENFEYEELAKAENIDQLNQLEKLYIDTLNSLAPNGYNLKEGGRLNLHYSVQSREKMSKAKLGRTLPDSVKQKMSNTHKTRFLDPIICEERGVQTRKAWMDPEYRQKISAARIHYWSKTENRKRASKRGKLSMTEAQKRLISERVKSATANPETQQKLAEFYKKQQRKVIRSDGVIFDSIREAAQQTGNTTGSSIIKNIQGKYKTAGGYTFKYYEDTHGIIAQDLSSKPTIYLLIGAPASGKSWVANQLLDKFDYISYDNNPKQNHLDLLLAPSTKPKLYDPTFKISTTIRRHSDKLNFILIAICETEEILRERMALRDGQWTHTIMNRNGEIQKRFAKYGANGFMGTSSEVLAYLRSLPTPQ